ncbi:class I SAM-dependent methyltransferase [Planctomycetota bacterium]|nr:class I SAM-dependent methyltransferase [Planctomycetota bacterium]
MWNDRYSVNEYVYGRDPNGFLAEVTPRLPKGGRALCLAEGEGRNAVWLAKQGYDVVAVDMSEVGLDKARQLAEQENVSIETVCSNLDDFVIEENQWDVIVVIFVPVQPELRRSIYSSVSRGLKKGGKFVVEMYTPRQLEMGTGGGSDINVMVDESVIRKELTGLKFEILEEKDRVILEGVYHTGKSAVVQLLAVKE